MTGSRAADCVDHASGLHIGESMFFTSTSILYVYRDVFFLGTQSQRQYKSLQEDILAQCDINTSAFTMVCVEGFPSTSPTSHERN